MTEAELRVLPDTPDAFIAWFAQQHPDTQYEVFSGAVAQDLSVPQCPIATWLASIGWDGYFLYEESYTYQGIRKTCPEWATYLQTSFCDLWYVWCDGYDENGGMEILVTARELWLEIPEHMIKGITPIWAGG